MVIKNFTYNGISYIGYNTISLYTRYEDTDKIIQFWGYKSENDVDTIYITIETTDINIETITASAIAELVG